MIGSEFTDREPLVSVPDTCTGMAEDGVEEAIGNHRTEERLFVHPLVMSPIRESWQQSLQHRHQYTQQQQQQHGLLHEVPRCTSQTDDSDEMRSYLPSPGLVGQKPGLLKKLTEGRHPKETRLNRSSWKNKRRGNTLKKFSSSSEALCKEEELEDNTLRVNEGESASRSLNMDRAIHRTRSLPSSLKMGLLYSAGSHTTCT